MGKRGKRKTKPPSTLPLPEMKQESNSPIRPPGPQRPLRFENSITISFGMFSEHAWVCTRCDKVSQSSRHDGKVFGYRCYDCFKQLPEKERDAMIETCEDKFVKMWLLLTKDK